MTQPIDPSGFQIAVVVRTAGGTFPLWIGGAVDGDTSIFYGSDGETFQDLPIVESVQVDVGMGLIGKVSVEISATYDLGLELLNSSLFAIGSVIDVQIGYPRIGRFLPWFSTMASKPSISINPDDGLSATLNGEGGAFAAARGSSSEVFNGSYASIIEDIANQESNGWALSLPDSSGESDPLYISREGVSQGNRTDWMFVQHISRLANCDAFIAPDPDTRGANILRVVRRSEAMSGQPRYTFWSRGNVDFINTFPIIGFESSAEGVWLPPREHQTADIHIRTREASESTLRPEDTDVPALPGRDTPGTGSEEDDGTVVATEPTPRDDRGTGRRVVAPAHATETPDEVLTSMVTEARQRGGLNASFETIGLPDIFPGEVVRLEGLGIFSGNYTIESVAHNAGAGEWTMSVKLLGDGVDANGLANGITQEWEGWNSQSAPQRQEADGGGTISVEPTVNDG